jgi:hypothetical protein
MNELLYFHRRIWLAATLIVTAFALSIPGFQDRPDLQTRIALAIPCILAGAWSLPPLLVKLTHALVGAYERITRRRVAEEA